MDKQERHKGEMNEGRKENGGIRRLGEKGGERERGRGEGEGNEDLKGRWKEEGEVKS